MVARGVEVFLVESAIAVNPALAGIAAVIAALKKGPRLVLVRHDSWSDEKLVDLAKASRDHPTAAVMVGHGRLHEDFTLTGLLERPRLLGPIAIRADRWPDIKLDHRKLLHDPVLDHAASWMMCVLCAGAGGEVACCENYHPKRAKHDPHDADELRPEGRAWLVNLATKLLPSESIGKTEAGKLWHTWSGGR
jgi:hypothetical protein